MSEQYVIRLKNGAYWIGLGAVTGNPDAAQKFASRWVALAEMAKVGRVMHEAAIVPWQRPGEREAKPSFQGPA